MTLNEISEKIYLIILQANVFDFCSDLSATPKTCETLRKLKNFHPEGEDGFGYLEYKKMGVNFWVHELEYNLEDGEVLLETDIGLNKGIKIKLW